MASDCKFSRPSLDDIERISKGLAATKRGVGSRMVPHRLNNAGRYCMYYTECSWTSLSSSADAA
jgi:hypothetical protein